ncbi:universal stress protein [Candidatus Bathyarchaeota archaeon]|nr:MAG: universal stress protein [Candidatus Bathyarchaeota archaeon]
MVKMEEGMKILVAYDGSSHADNALKEAVDVAKKFNASMEVVHCIWEEPDAESMNLLKTKEALLKESGVKYKLRSERTPNVGARILKIANSEGFGLITMCTRGMGLAKAMILWSVSSKVTEGASCSVLVTK